MKSERDELANILFRKMRGRVTDTAEAILEAGYRKPQTTTAADELWDLPVLSVISDCHGHVYQKFESDDNDAWLAGGEFDAWIAEDILNNFAPVTILRVGDSHV